MSNTVAVIVPTYNRASTLSRALDSVYAQTRRADEVCVVDDGSVDDTEELIRSRYPEAIYIRQENAGVSAARNRGVEATVSNYVAFLDSDDEWLPSKIEKQLSALNENPQYRIVHSDEIWIRNGKRVNQMGKHRKGGGEIFSRCLPLCVISPSAAVIDRRLFMELGGFDEALPACEDYDLWLRICRREQVLYIDTPLLRKFGGHADQLSIKHWGMDRFRVQSLIKLLDSEILTAEQDRLVRVTLKEKAGILHNGAVKRDKAETAEYYANLLENYCAAVQEN